MITMYVDVLIIAALTMQTDKAWKGISKEMNADVIY